MANLSTTRSYADGNILLEADLDSFLDDIETFLNTTKINDDNIQNGGITGSTKLATGTVTAASLGTSAVTTIKINDSAVTTDKINNLAVTTAKIAANAVTAAKIASVDAPVVGEVKMFHTFNGTISVPRGWMIMNGDVVNETNYETIHGVGTYTTDGVASSALLALNLPDMSSRYPVGVTATSQDGSTTITTVGNASNQINIAHTHTTAAHRHAIYDYVGDTAHAKGFDTNGVANVDLQANSASTTYTHIQTGTSSSIVTDLFSSAVSAGATGSGLSATQSIQPESIELIYIMKVI